MKPHTNILIASDSPADAVLVSDLLSGEFENISGSTDARCIASDFEAHQPAVLILAFKTLENAEAYYSELYRLSPMAQTLPRQTLILCTQKDLLRVCALCNQEHFNDYILFWPVTRDPGRLSTTVNRALRQISGPDPLRREIEAQARRIAELESQLAKYGTIGPAPVETADRPSRHSEPAIVPTRPASFGNSQDFPAKASPAPAQPAALAERLVTETPRPILLIVDDDDFQHRLLTHLFSGEALELEFAASGVDALSVIRNRRPDLVLMDFNLPDIDGIEVTRVLKSIKQFANIPVVMITGHGDKDVVMASMDAGAADFVVKPFDRNTLLSKVRKLLTADPLPEGHSATVLQSLTPALK